jgi:hypothetical protein
MEGIFMQDTTFIQRNYALTDIEDYKQNIIPQFENRPENEIVVAEPQHSHGLLIGWTIITTWK